MGEDKRGEQPNPHPRKTDHIRDNLVIEVDDRNDNQARDESEKEEITPGDAILNKQNQRKKRSRPLDERVLDRNGLMTEAASASQEEVTEDRNIVIKPDGMVTVRAVGPREDNRFISRQPTDADVQKAADEGPEDD